MSRHKKWGHGSGILTTAHRRRAPRDDGWDGDFGAANDNVNDDGANDCEDGVQSGGSGSDDDENPFESICRALDQREKKAKRIKEAEESKSFAGHEQERAAVSVDNDGSPEHEDDIQPKKETSLGFDRKSGRGRLSIDGSVKRLSLDSGVNPTKSESDQRYNETGNDESAKNKNQAITTDDKTPAQKKSTTNRLQQRHSFDSSIKRKSRNPRQVENITGQNSQASKRVRESSGSSMKKSTTPPRFSFSYAQSSAKSKNKNGSNSNTNNVKTPSHNHKSLPSRDLFSSRRLSQKSGKKSIIQTQTFSSNGELITQQQQSSSMTMKTTTQKQRKNRHSFRQSFDRASNNNNNNNTPGMVNNNVRDIGGFVPTFLANAKNTGSGITSPKDAPAADDDDEEYSNSQKTTAFSQNIITEYQRQLQSQRKAEAAALSASNANNAKSVGYLVQRLRSLQGNNQRMAMRSKSGSGQYSTNSTLTPTSSLSGAGTGSSAFLSRKRRRSGGNDNLDPKTSASTTLDVTVSGTSLSGDTALASAFGEGRSVLVAYIHQHMNIVTKQSTGQSNLFIDNGMTPPCFAWIIMSREVMRERGIVDGGCTKQLRFYDAVVIPPRVASSIHHQSSGASKENGIHRNDDSIYMPTIICTQVCQEYPAEQLPLENVSFDQFM